MWVSVSRLHRGERLSALVYDRHMEPEAWSDTEKTYALQLLQSGRLSRTYLVRLALALISYEKKDRAGIFPIRRGNWI